MVPSIDVYSALFGGAFLTGVFVFVYVMGDVIPQLVISLANLVDTFLRCKFKLDETKGGEK